jgi:DNA (cytosine-5)-methyltransferase 1
LNIEVHAMTFGSLFAGIGGFDLGFERAGMECRWQVEIDPYCQRVLAKHWPNVRRWDDVRTFASECLVERVDVICGGFPCQDISIAGNGDGIDGKRSGLWAEFSRIIGVVRPKFAVVENVAAIITQRRGIDRVCGDLADIGYDAEWEIVPACIFGAPHTRERVFITAYAREIGWPGPREHTHRQHEIPRGLHAWEAKATGSKWRHVQRWIKSLVEDGGGIVPASERGGMADGIPDRLDRIGSCGNAVVPQVAEWIGRRIMGANR